MLKQSLVPKAAKAATALVAPAAAAAPILVLSQVPLVLVVMVSPMPSPDLVKREADPVVNPRPQTGAIIVIMALTAGMTAVLCRG